MPSPSDVYYRSRHLVAVPRLLFLLHDVFFHMAYNYLSSGFGPILLLSACSILAFTWIFSLIRIFVRIHILQLWRIEDWLFLISLVSFTLLVVATIVSVLYGNGQLIRDIRPRDISSAVQSWIYTRILYTETTIFTRLSVACFLLQLAPRNRRYRLTIIYTLVFATSAGTLLLLANIFPCIPDFHIPGKSEATQSAGLCIPLRLFPLLTVIHASIGTVADIILALLPTAIVYHLPISLQQKITICVLLGLGLLAGLTNLVRIACILSAATDAEILYASTYVTLWNMVEPATAVVCLSLSVFRPLFHHRGSVETEVSGKDLKDKDPESLVIPPSCLASHPA